MNVIEEFLPVVPFIMLHKLVINFSSIIDLNHSKNNIKLDFEQRLKWFTF